jgi:23S rRNA (pseudouridine1915-N3)-methyltransferase
MQLKLIALGKKMPEWVSQACEEFEKRLTPYASLKTIELDIPKRSKNTSIEKLKKIEAELILQQCDKAETLVALDEHGQQWTSPQFANKLQTWHDENLTVNFVVGGPDGLDTSIIAQAQYHWSLGKLVYPHALVRVLVIEQLYRGFSILNNHPYHRS